MRSIALAGFGTSRRRNVVRPGHVLGSAASVAANDRVSVTTR